jgi:hypothetical protein
MGKRNLWQLSTIASVCMMLAACDGGGDSSDGAGKLSVSITDAPIHDAQSVTVNFLGAEVKPADGPALRFYFCEDPIDPINEPTVLQDNECAESAPYIKKIDLLKQTAGVSALLLDGVEIPAGKVNWVRLVLADEAGEIVLSTGAFPLTLTVPSGSQTGLKLNQGFVVPEDGEAKVYIDFDVRKSIVEVHSTVPPSYKLKPTLRMVEDVYGAIVGEVSATLMAPECLGGSIYVFSGAGATPDDIDRDLGDPVTSTLVKADGSPTGFSYHVDFLVPGDYTVAFVCADEDDPDEDDQLSFTKASDTATVVDDQTVQIDF